ncbi:DUF6431 domain-containing protein [Anaerorhabdus sp.]|uniref:DUF6431 domain-containing protein n=1 Tax=Anaerorhabdus sp. TaxID=1872524 RepID=UPI003FA606F0
MITILLENFNYNLINQETYDLYINSLCLSSIPCPKCNQIHCLIYHASYNRYLKTRSNKIKLKIQRVLCTNCNSTHALLPSFIVPYSQITTSAMISIITSDHRSSYLDEHPLLDESNLRYILKQYNRLFKPFLSNIASLNITSIIKRCFFSVSKMFMQIKNTINSLFIVPT